MRGSNYSECVVGVNGLVGGYYNGASLEDGDQLLNKNNSNEDKEQQRCQSSRGVLNLGFPFDPPKAYLREKIDCLKN